MNCVLKSAPIRLICLWTFLYSFLPLCVSLRTEYMESSCGSTTSFSKSFQLESSTGLTYLNLLDCSYTVTVPNGFYVLAVITRFELELAVSGVCTDYLDVHDGVDTSATKLTTSLLCGTGSSIPGNFTSSGQSLTLRLVTDSTGTYLGFNIIFAAITYAPCSSSQYTCNTSVCIDSSLECDSYNQCGDSSDEDNCPAISSDSGLNVVMVVIICLAVVAVLAVIAGLIAYRIYSRNRWQKFLNSHIDDDDGIVPPGPSYPITHKYYKGIKGHPGSFNNATTKEFDAVETEGDKSAPNRETSAASTSVST